MSSEISLLDALAKIAAMTVKENLLHALSSPDAHTYKTFPQLPFQFLSETNGLG